MRPADASAGLSVHAVPLKSLGLTLQVLAAKRDNTRSKMVSFLQIFLFVRLDHQFMHDNDIPIGQWFGGLQAEFHNCTTTFVDFHKSPGAGNAVDTIIYSWTDYFKISKLNQLLKLVLR